MSMPKRSAQKVLSSANTIVPPWLSSRKMRSASVVLFIWIESENPSVPRSGLV